MIKLEHVVLASPEQMKFIIEGLRNPLNSWEKSDSYGFCSLSLCIIKDICSCRNELQRSSINKKSSVECMLIRMLETLKGEII